MIPHQRAIASGWWFQANVDQIDTNFEQTGSLEDALRATLDFGEAYIQELDEVIDNDLWEGTFTDMVDHLRRIDGMLLRLLQLTEARPIRLPVNGRYVALIARIDAGRRLINLGDDSIRWTEDSADLQPHYLHRSRAFLRDQNAQMVANLLTERAVAPRLPPELTEIVRSLIVGLDDDDDDSGDDIEEGWDLSSEDEGLG